MAKATRTPGNPGTPDKVTTDHVDVIGSHNLKRGDRITYVSAVRDAFEVIREVTEPGVPATPGTVTLELSEAEAQVIYDITAHIAGDQGSRRGLTNAIGKALYDAGVKHTGRYGANDLVTGSLLQFEDRH